MIDLITLHPKLVHFPISMIVLAFFFETLYFWKKKSFYSKVSLWMVHLGFFFAVITMISGSLAADAIGHDTPFHDHVHEHRDFMYIAAALWLLFIIGLRFINRLKEERGSIIRLIILLCVCTVLFIGAHEGGELVYEYGIGVKVQKKNMKKSSGKDHKTEKHDHDHKH